ncbi:carbohydrate kinase [Planococcus lenghuensis]|uniref:Carbohydrate kinase n=1 Tax=Planococcus lenghuensis TaxID=2213202 RepID=A0A1Q2KXU3_9BACL|nr:carbohydrate kinase [Planococcus lenghuensis]AQQ52482.1 carbohydrate kinase [Planococcus lenghuensis]
MGRKEDEVLELIRRNPYMSQQEMAERLKISRPSLANMISSLIREGKVLGRAYMLPEKGTVICIGGANVDRKFLLSEPLQMGTSNPVSATKSAGGVARNIAENLGRLGHEVKLLSVVGRDNDWQTIEEGSAAFMSLELTETLRELPTGSYTAVLDTDGEMMFAMADMEICDLLTPEHLSRYESVLLSAALIVIDLNCPAETVSFVQQLAESREIPLAVIAVSAPKMDRLGATLRGITWFVCNMDEAESYIGEPIKTDEQWRHAVWEFVDLGARNVAITAGERGVMAGNIQSVQHFPALPIEEMTDVTGAGDAFSSALLHGYLNTFAFPDVVKAGLTNAIKTLESPLTVRTELTAAGLKNEMEELQ